MADLPSAVFWAFQAKARHAPLERTFALADFSKPVSQQDPRVGSGSNHPHPCPALFDVAQNSRPDLF
jgi:hypothetical protein